MAVASVVLNIKANTDRALNDFKRFSAQLDNKFLVSGLKLDVVRSALSQINREFQKAIGDQGLTAGQSLLAAQNQAAAILNVFKSVGPEASKALTDQFSTAFSRIAIQAGGTSDDIKKALSATPFISTNLSKEVRDSLNAAIMGVQVDMRRAGLGEDFGGVVRQFLAGELSAGQMMGSESALQNQLGNELLRKTGNMAVMTNAQQRSEAIFAVVSDPAFRKSLSDSAKEAYGFRATIEDLNTRLFNPKEGVFGVLREVTMGIGDKTNIFRETGALVESVFGRQGLFVNFFKQIGKIFGIEDPLKVIIIGVRFVTRQFDKLNDFVQSPGVQGMVKKIQETFNVIKKFFTDLYQQVIKDFSDPTSLVGQVKQIGTKIGQFFEQLYTAISTGAWDPASAVASIQEVGKAARGFIEQIGKSFRDMDVEKQGSLFLEIFKTMVAEVAQTLGTAIKEAILSIFSSKGLAVLGGVVGVLYEALNKFFTGLFGGNKGIGAALGGVAMAGLGVLLARKIREVFMSILRPIQALRTGGGGALGVVNRLLGGGRGGGDLDPSARGPSSMLGTAQAFNRQVIFYLQKIAACVCGPGGIGGGGDTPQSRRERARTGRGPQGAGMPRRAPLTSLDTVNPYAYGNNGAYLPSPDVRRSFLASRKESARNILGRGSSSAALEAYTESLGGPYGPLSDLDVDQRRSRASEIAGGQGLADRYNRRYSRRARIGRGMRGFGKGALIAGGLTAAAVGIGSLFGGGDAQASEFDPATGLPIEQPKASAGNAFGAMAGGAAKGALDGAMYGSVLGPKGAIAGAVIGAVIGGVAPLLDEGTRKGVKEFTDGVGKSLKNAGASISKAANGGIQFIKDGFGSISKWFGNIDWKTVLINALVPGGSMAIEGLKGIAEFASKLNIFDGIKAGIDSIADPVKNIWNNISSWKPPWAREVGGPVIKGTSYIVGERGPEIFTPGASGSISTNRDLMAMRAGGKSASSVSASFNIAINVNGAMGAGDVEALRGPVLRIVEEAWASATQGTVSRGAVG